MCKGVIHGFLCKDSADMCQLVKKTRECAQGRRRLPVAATVHHRCFCSIPSPVSDDRLGRLVGLSVTAKSSASFPRCPGCYGLPQTVQIFIHSIIRISRAHSRSCWLGASFRVLHSIQPSSQSIHCQPGDHHKKHLLILRSFCGHFRAPPCNSAFPSSSTGSFPLWFVGQPASQPAIVGYLLGTTIGHNCPQYPAKWIIPSQQLCRPHNFAAPNNFAVHTTTSVLGPDRGTNSFSNSFFDFFSDKLCHRLKPETRASACHLPIASGGTTGGTTGEAGSRQKGLGRAGLGWHKSSRGRQLGTATANARIAWPIVWPPEKMPRVPTADRQWRRGWQWRRQSSSLFSAAWLFLSNFLPFPSTFLPESFPPLHFFPGLFFPFSVNSQRPPRRNCSWKAFVEEGKY